MIEHFARLQQTPDESTAKILRLLNKQLAGTLDLRSRVRQSYFNVKGPYDRELRSLFDGLAFELRRLANLIATSIQGMEGIAADLHGGKFWSFRQWRPRVKQE